MQWKFFRIPVNDHDNFEAEFNLFLRTQRVLTIHREFVSQGENSYWSLAVEYLAEGGEAARRADGKRQKIDYRELLTPDDFALFVRLREWRKVVADREAVPVYTIATNEQLAEIVRRRCSSKTALAQIDGIGRGRIEKYGEMVLQVMAGGVDDETHQ